MTVALENSSSSYRFFPNNRFSWKAIQHTYRECLKFNVSFWTEQNYDIAYRTTLPVLLSLIFLESLIGGCLNARFDFMGQFVGRIAILSLQCGFLGFIVLMKEWLEARGDFKQYLAFSTYAHFVLLPFVLIAGVPQIGALIKLCATLWILYGFYRAFSLFWSRFLVLMGILFGIGLLGFLAALFAGLKFFV